MEKVCVGDVDGVGEIDDDDDDYVENVEKMVQKM